LQENQKPDLIGQRYAKLEQIKQLGHAAYPHSYNFSHTLPQILDAYQGQGNAIRKRDEVHKMAQANKAFAHFRW